MPYSIVLFTRSGAYEPGSRYYLVASPVPNQANVAAGIADAQALLIPNSITISRWELLDPTGTKIDEGVLAVSGTVASEYSTFKFASFIRLNSAGDKRPSTKYVHPLPETFLTNGVPTAACLNAVGTYGSDLVSYDVADSEGVPISSAQFRHGTRRKHVRLAE